MNREYFLGILCGLCCIIAATLNHFGNSSWGWFIFFALLLLLEL